jgi:hypothetical protein
MTFRSHQNIPVELSARQTVDWARVEGSAETVIIVASGPSLRAFPFYRLRGRGFVIAVNNAARAVPFANAWVTVDTMRLGDRIPARFDGTRYIAAPEEFGSPDARCPCDRHIPDFDVKYLRRIDQPTLAEDPTVLHGLNSAFGALNFAYHLRPRRIVMFGVDANRFEAYFYGHRQATRKQNRVIQDMPDVFASAVPQLEAAGIEVLNASAASSVRCFPRMDSQTALNRLRSWTPFAR